MNVEKLSKENLKLRFDEEIESGCKVAGAVGDSKSRFFHVEIFDKDNVDVDFDSSFTLKLVCKDEAGNVYESVAENDSGAFKVEIPSAVFNKKQMVQFQFVLIDNDVKLHSSIFERKIEPSIQGEVKDGQGNVMEISEFLELVNNVKAIKQDLKETEDETNNALINLRSETTDAKMKIDEAVENAKNTIQSAVNDANSKIATASMDAVNSFYNSKDVAVQSAEGSIEEAKENAIKEVKKASDYYSKTETDSKLENYYTKEEVDEKVKANASAGGNSESEKKLVEYLKNLLGES